MWNRHQQHFDLRIKNKMEKYQNTPMVLLITQNTHVQISKYPQRQSFFFVFSEAKNVFLQYIKLKKPKIPLSSSPSFFYIGGKEVFLLLRIL
jgi:hypothetical protein